MNHVMGTTVYVFWQALDNSEYITNLLLRKYITEGKQCFKTSHCQINHISPYFCDALLYKFE